jgi:hypothetical protein
LNEKLRSHKYDVIGINAHVSTEGNNGDTKHHFYKKLEQVLDHFSAYYMKKFSGEFNPKVARENIFKPIIWKRIYVRGMAIEV